MNDRSHSRIRRIARTALAWLLMATMLLPTLTVMPAAAAGAVTTLDFSNPSSPVTVEVGAAEFVSLLTGQQISSAERTYLNASFSDDALLYSDAIDSNCVKTAFEGTTLTVLAKSYSYMAPSGAQVSWVPTTASLNGKMRGLEYSFASAAYETEYADVDASAKHQLTVSYSCTLTIPAAVSDYYINYAYDYAFELWEKSYRYREYHAQLRAHEDYLAAKATYDTDLAAWETYCAEKSKYDAKYALYEQYLADYQAYEQAYAAFEQYLADEAAYAGKLAAFEQYLSDQQSYGQRLADYEAYMAQLAKVEATLAVIESAFVSNSQGKQLYATLMGGTVDSVVNRRDELTALGVSKAVLDDTAASTNALKSLLSGYVACSTITEKWNYYKQNYSAINSNMGRLSSSLESLLEVGGVKSALEVVFNKLDRYLEFVSQLYVISSGLDDSIARSTAWTIKGLGKWEVYGYSDLLESCQIPADNNNANPAGLPALGAPVEKPTVPTPVEQPTLPTPVAKPVEPDVVLEPVAPTPVTEPTKPEPVDHPGAEPVLPNYTEQQQALVDAIDNGSLARRRVGTDKTIRFTTSLAMTVASAQLSIVTFYDYDGKTVLDQQTLIRGNKIEYKGEEPVREQTPKNTYTFAGWKDAQGESVSDFGQASASIMNFYAAYDATLRSYTVTWDVDGVMTRATYDYGEMPTYQRGTPTKEPDQQNAYEFVGWSPDLLPVTEDTTYVANWRTVARKCAVVWKVDGKEIREEYLLGEVPTFKGSTEKAADLEYLYQFRGWDRRPAALTGDATYTAVYEAVPLVQDSDDSVVTLIDTGTTYRIVSTGNRVRIERLLEVAMQQDRAVEIVLRDGDATLLLGEALLGDLRAKGCADVALVALQAEDMQDAYEICFLNAAGEALSTAYNFTLQAACMGIAGESTLVYTTTADGGREELAAQYDAESGRLTVKCKGSVALYFRNEYAITVAEDGEGEKSAVITLPARRLRQGESLVFTLRYEDGYRVDFVTVMGETSGVVYPLTENEDGSYSFDMPAENVCIRSALLPCEYTVSFVVDGVQIASDVYRWGDTVTVPADPTKEQQENTVFTFTGWSPTVTTVNGDAVYTATFSTATVGDQHTGIPEYKPGFNYVLFFGILFLVLMTGGIVLLIIRRKKKKATSAAAATVAQTPAEDAPAEETPAEEAPAEETPAEDAPAKEVPAEETPVEETPAEETPAEETPAEDAPAEETPAEDAPAKEKPPKEPAGEKIKALAGKLAAAAVLLAKRTAAGMKRAAAAVWCGCKWIGHGFVKGCKCVGRGVVKACKWLGAAYLSLWNAITKNAILDAEELSTAAMQEKQAQKKQKETSVDEEDDFFFDD